MRTAILGMGVTGLSCLRHLAGRDALVVLDTRDAPPNASAARAEFGEVPLHFGAAAEAFDFAGVDRMVVSPGISLEHCLVARARSAGVEVLSDIDLFCAAATAAAPVYAITGTNGKSTVTALVGHLLAGLGRSPGVGGNLGQAALDLLDRDHDCFVLELSSFQLERMGDHPLHAATILNVTEDHLDRHDSLADYAAVKQRIYRRAARTVANRHDPLTQPGALATADLAARITFGLDTPQPGHWGVIALETGAALAWGERPVIAVDDLPLTGTHNVLNVLAALALVAEPEVDPAPLAGALAGFVGLPHRCQPVGEIAGVRYVDDSKATNVGAAIAALEGLGSAGPRRLVLIAGGDGKGADFTPLAEPVKRFVKAVVLLGRDAPLLERALTGSAPVSRVADMDAAVRAAAALAESGDTVLLSPACASLDMFRNYAARGAAFAAAVEGLR